MADNKPKIEEEHFKMYIDPKYKDNKDRNCKEYFSLITNSGVHVLCNTLETNDIFILSMGKPNSLSISQRQIKELQKLRLCGLAFKDNDTLIICGGLNEELDVVTNACYEYSISKNEVKRLPDMITERWKFVIFYQDDKIYVFGGDDDDDYYIKNCEYFDFTTKKWIRMADLNRRQSGGSVINYKDEFWLIGEFIIDSKGYLIERYIRSKNLWEIVDIKFSFKFCRPVFCCHLVKTKF